MATMILPSSGETDSDLVQATIAGNVDAFGELIGRYDRMVFHVAQCVTHNREDAQDAVQEACLKAYKRLSQFKGVSKFSTWLVRITVNEALMKVRRRQRKDVSVVDDDQDLDEVTTAIPAGEWSRNPEDLCYNAEVKKLLANALQSLRPGIRAAFWLRYVEGLSTEEVAEALCLSLPALKARLFRARAQLRGKLSRALNMQPSRGASKRQTRRVQENELCSTAPTVHRPDKTHALEASLSAHY